VLQDQAARGVKLTRRQTVVLSQLDFRFYPEFGFAVGPIDVDVYTWFFAREEIETKAPVPEDRWAHQNESMNGFKFRTNEQALF